MNNVNSRNFNDERLQYESPSVVAWRFDEPESLATGGVSAFFQEAGRATFDQWADDEE